MKRDGEPQGCHFTHVAREGDVGADDDGEVQARDTDPRHHAGRPIAGTGRARGPLEAMAPLGE